MSNLDPRFGPKAAATAQIRVLAEQCAKTDWDGQGGEPIHEVAVALTADFIRALPENIPLPESAPEPDGSISLDWIQSSSRLLSLSLSASSGLAWTWLDGADRGHAVDQFDGRTVPPRLVEAVTRIMGRVSERG